VVMLPPALAERRWRLLLVVSVAVLMASLDQFIVNIAFPSIRRDLGGASVAEVSWVLNAYAIVFAALLVPAGRLADLVGRRRTFLAGVLIFVLGSALCGAAPSVGALIAARVVQAAGAAPGSPGLGAPGGRGRAAGARPGRGARLGLGQREDTGHRGRVGRRPRRLLGPLPPAPFAGDRPVDAARSLVRHGRQRPGAVL